ncbi:VRR-NUC domain-containing protein [Halomonas sp. TRM85114]|uniref:VRR-NUC domain-containing protein n=1 Tax=Halomonas jincaotanensis TaxID=2810616 RepID=UPI001BD48F69|nr:VRR-NUC domain-containing protein [Halomonas jincaotanensis]MBS9403798.1 VRR-NUC domain-containing protein [Halomonas jincaotanensis]
MNSAFPPSAVTAPLDDPFYYLVNFRFVLEWVAERHGDLLNETERDFIIGFAVLPRPTQALLVRMVMRKGEHFRQAKLAYAEIGDTSAALASLVEAGWVDPDPVLSLEVLFRQLRLKELRNALAGESAAAGLTSTAGKAQLHEALSPRLTEPRRLTDWWPSAADRIVRLTVMATCDRLRLMFFGNLRQDWSEFVLAELGLQRFERVPFASSSRVFQHRHEVDAYLAMHRLRERLEEGEASVSLHAELPDIPPDNAWLYGRRNRLLYQLGREAERAGQLDAAVALYAEAGHGETGEREARIRHLRLLERCGEHARAHTLAERALGTIADGSGDDAEAQALERLLPRLRRRLGRPALPRAVEPVTERWSLCLPSLGRDGTACCVELAVRDYLSRERAPVHYVENTLLTGLFGLLCWEAVFAPLPGAFFHPFHSGPADLYREDFVKRRRERFAACLGKLADGSYREAIRATWREKYGLVSPFVSWGVLNESLIDQALDGLPAEHLQLCFERLLSDLKANRAGLPDLIQFLPQAGGVAPRYRFIEVKGPGDRLQDNQRRWLAFFHRHAMPAVVCHVTWQAEP